METVEKTETNTDEPLIYTIIDFLAAALFVMGSIFFFREATYTLGIWMYLLGSFGFGFQPTIKLIKRFQAWRTAQQRSNQG